MKPVTHFVYPYIIPQNPIFGWELLYSIRSIYQNFKDPFDITLIGEIPKWVNTTEIKCILWDNSDPVKYPRVQFRTNEKLLIAADMYEDLVFIHDDMYFIDTVTREDLTTIRYLADDLLYQGTPQEDKRLTRFQKQLRYTSFKLKEMGKPYIRNFATHTPFYYQSDKLKELSKVFNLVEVGGQSAPVTEVAYYNYFEVNSIPIYDFRIGYWDNKPEGNMQTAKVLNHDEIGFIKNPGILTFLWNMFKNKCPAEKYEKK
jgi:hypothetical protein